MVPIFRVMCGGGLGWFFYQPIRWVALAGERKTWDPANGVGVIYFPVTGIGRNRSQLDLKSCHIRLYAMLDVDHGV